MKLLLSTLLLTGYLTSCAEDPSLEQHKAPAEATEDKDQPEVEAPEKTVTQSEEIPEDQSESTPNNETPEEGSELYGKLLDVLKLIPIESIGLEDVDEVSLIQYLIKNLPDNAIEVSMDELSKAVESIIFDGVLNGEDLSESVFKEGQLLIEDISATGTGCLDADNIAYDISTDGQAFTIIYDEFYAETFGEGNNSLEVAESNCDVSIKMKSPKGWAYAVMSIQQSVYLSQDNNTTSTHSTSYKFASDDGEVKLANYVIEDEYDDQFIREDKIRLANLQWSGCNGEETLVVKTSLKVESQNASTGYINVDSLDGEIRENYQLVWKKCD